MGELVGVDMKTFLRLEADKIQPVNPRGTKILAAIRDVFEKAGVRLLS